MNQARTLPALSLCTLLAACGSIQYTVDDGRQVDANLLANIRAYGQGQQAIKTAIARAAKNPPKDCETTWDLPFAAVSSDHLPNNDRVAWVRALQTDERLTVIASSPRSTLQPGDKLLSLDGYSSRDGQKMADKLQELRKQGQPFFVSTSKQQQVRIEPLAVCRGLSRPADPANPETQDYHWQYSVHPLELFKALPDADEALWIVLWTQGLSEQAGARMKAYRYGLAPFKLLLGATQIVNGAGAISRAAAVSGTAAANQAGGLVASGVASNVAKKETEEMIFASSQNRSNLEGVSWAAGTAFDKADQWAFERMRELSANPLAAFTLSEKLIAAGSAKNAFVLDQQRHPLLLATARTHGLDPQATPETTPTLTYADLDIEHMPTADRWFDAPTATSIANIPVDERMPFATKKQGEFN